MQEMVIDSIRFSVQNYGQRVVILRQKDSTPGIYLPIWIGASEAESIAMRLQEVDAPRPLTHDLLTTAIDSLGAKVLSVIVSDLKDDTFFAKILLEYQDSTIELDSRPSDAIAIAVRSKAKIFAENLVVEKAGVTLNQETDTDNQPNIENEEKLSAFKDFVDTLDIDDIGNIRK
jgi:bifunctional DNase/RNase